MPTRKLDAGNPHVRFDEGEGSYRTLSTLHLFAPSRPEATRIW
jgi:hypothetical protein